VGAGVVVDDAFGSRDPVGFLDCFGRFTATLRLLAFAAIGRSFSGLTEGRS